MALPEPYYEKQGCRIYCGDSRVIMEELPRVFHIVVTDPPYGIDQDPQKFDKDSGFKKVKDDDVPFDPFQVCHMAPQVVLWGANNFFMDLPLTWVLPPEYGPAGGWLFWDKTMDNDVKVKISHGELAWCNNFRGIRAFRHLWSGAYRASEPGFHVHPTQKPVVLMKWVLEMFTQPGDIVLDPYMGSGPVLQAAYELGRRYVGIEWEEEYCAVAKKRIAIDRLFGDLP